MSSETLRWTAEFGRLIIIMSRLQLSSRAIVPYQRTEIVEIQELLQYVRADDLSKGPSSPRITGKPEAGAVASGNHGIAFRQQ
jgi:hypothetical protein